jgi:hypothetical protein
VRTPIDWRNGIAAASRMTHMATVPKSNFEGIAVTNSLAGHTLGSYDGDIVVSSQTSLDERRLSQLLASIHSKLLSNSI